MSDDLTLAEALRLVDTARATAESNGLAVTVAVVDPGGHLVALARMDATPFVITEMAIGKAYTAAAFGTTSAAVARTLDGRTQFTTAIQVATSGRLVLSEGGFPIVRAGTTIGGFAVSGGTGEQDADVAGAALTACGFTVG
jgi:glc operon protein GlcG